MISGGIKFFTKSRCGYADGATMVATSGNDSANYALDRNPISIWRSVGSVDTITETLIVNLSGNLQINRLFLVDMNWKEFSVKYLSGGSYVNFTNVVGISGSQASVTETAYARDTAYYEFDAVTTTSLQIEVTKTQVVDKEKYIAMIIATLELGTLEGYPKIKKPVIDRNVRKQEVLSGRSLVMKSETSFSVDLDFDSYPARLTADIDLAFYLFDSEENFIVWLCGGRVGTPYFKKQMWGYRLKDVYTVQVVKPIQPVYSNNTYVNTVNFSLALEEAVD